MEAKYEYRILHDGPASLDLESLAVLGSEGWQFSAKDGNKYLFCRLLEVTHKHIFKRVEKTSATQTF